MRELRIRTGTMRIPFEQNRRIALANLMAGRPLFEGMLPAEYIPDPDLPEWWVVQVPDSANGQ